MTGGPPPDLQGSRVLLVEDESAIAMLVEDMLLDLGCEVALSASNLAEALAKATEGGFELALLDVNLAGARVFPVAELLASRGIPFAFASGYGASGLPPEYQDRPVVAKPFRAADLAAGLQQALAGPPPSRLR
jgi:CheY-like chemotaxis protein